MAGSATGVVIAAVVSLLILVTSHGVGDGAPPSSTGGAPSTSAAPTAGMRLVFSDDFEGSSLDRAKWNECYPWADDGRGCTNFGNPEIQWYLPSQVRVRDGSLDLVAVKERTVGTDRQGRPTTYPWRSGMVTTARSSSFTYGYVEAVARPPKGDGFWAAVWLLPQDGQYPPEIDIAELYGAYPTELAVAYHPASGERPIRNNASTSDLTRRWHTYGVDWRADSITWYLDGKAVHRYEGPTPDEPMYLLANLAVANIFGAGPTSSTPSEAAFEIRRIAIYQR